MPLRRGERDRVTVHLLLLTRAQRAALSPIAARLVLAPTRKDHQ